jgi:hypothetical protein
VFAFLRKCSGLQVVIAVAVAAVLAGLAVFACVKAAADSERAWLLPGATASVVAMLDLDASVAHLTTALASGGEELCQWPLPLDLMARIFLVPSSFRLSANGQVTGDVTPGSNLLHLADALKTCRRTS